MRSFTDPDGQPWDAALLDASYGNILLIFSQPRGQDIRQQLLGAENMAEAETLLANYNDDDLRELLANAQAWDPTRLF
ncbi:hypothetical protein [Castellaniella caeni]|uniref:hypothetical protein n=1 Tax=Castellaniella caeni TaxID=266123 RepID=UPI00082B8495|nr:hypothetical protein [Castellaniella caeni]